MSRLSYSVAVPALLCALACGGDIDEDQNGREGSASPSEGGSGSSAGASPGAPGRGDLASADWMKIGEHEGKPAIKHWCTAEAQKLSVDGSDDLTIAHGQDATILHIKSAAPAGDVLEMEMVDPAGAPAGTVKVRWDGPQKSRLIWTLSDDGEWQTVSAKALGDVLDLKECCVEVEGEMPGEGYAWVPSNSECPPAPG